MVIINKIKISSQNFDIAKYISNYILCNNGYAMFQILELSEFRFSLSYNKLFTIRLEQTT